MTSPVAYLFPNGNALFFDEHGEQLPKHQKQGIPGVHNFLADYPDAPVYFTEWDDLGDKKIELSDPAINHIKQP